MKTSDSWELQSHAAREDSVLESSAFAHWTKLGAESDDDEDDDETKPLPERMQDRASGYVAPDSWESVV